MTYRYRCARCGQLCRVWLSEPILVGAWRSLALVLRRDCNCAPISFAASVNLDMTLGQAYARLNEMLAGWRDEVICG